MCDTDTMIGVHGFSAMEGVLSSVRPLCIDAFPYLSLHRCLETALMPCPPLLAADLKYIHHQVKRPFHTSLVFLSQGYLPMKILPP